MYDQDYYRAIFKAHPELLAFLHPDVQATADYTTTSQAPWMRDMYMAAQTAIRDVERPEGYSETTLGGIIDQVVLSARRSIELERTMLCLMAFDAVSTHQNKRFFDHTNGAPLSEEQFARLKALLAQCMSHASTEDHLVVIALELILGDLGKIQPLREALCAALGIEHQDPDHFIGELLLRDYDTVAAHLPSIRAISPEIYQELQKANLGFHYGHFLHAESTAREVATLKQKLQMRGLRYLYLNMFVQMMAVAGACAQDNGKVLLNQPITNAYLEDMLPLLEKLVTEDADPAQVILQPEDAVLQEGMLLLFSEPTARTPIAGAASADAFAPPPRPDTPRP